MKKSIYIILLIAVLVIIAGVVIHNLNPKSQTGTVLFYSKQCPHCAKVIAFINANKVRNKIAFSEKEVSQNRDNLLQLIKVQKQCDIPVKEYVEIPLLQYGTKCVTGDQNIISFLKQKIAS